VLARPDDASNTEHGGSSHDGVIHGAGTLVATLISTAYGPNYDQGRIEPAAHSRELSKEHARLDDASLTNTITRAVAWRLCDVPDAAAVGTLMNF
jgi:hypothetical protein